MSFQRITVDPRRIGGLLCVQDLRSPVSTVIGQLAARRTPSQILADIPGLEEEDIYAALEFVAAAVHERELPVVPQPVRLVVDAKSVTSGRSTAPRSRPRRRARPGDRPPAHI